MEFDIGIGTTNRCNFNCAHCYSRSEQLADLALEDIRKLVAGLDVTTINFGTGENILNPEFPKIMEFLHSRGIKMSLTSNGYSVLKLSDEHLRLLNDVDVSLDFAEEPKNDIFRAEESSVYVRKAIDRLMALGVETSVVTCLTNRNFDELLMILEFVRKRRINWRLNVYKPVHSQEFTLTYDQFWSAMKCIFENAHVISCSEPVVNAVIGTKVLDGGCPCGKNSFRVTPFKTIKPCVYWNDSDVTLDDFAREGPSAIANSPLFAKVRHIPEFCTDCAELGLCKGGCAARRLYSGDFSKPDFYCYKYNGREKPSLPLVHADPKSLVHSNYLCTVIVE